MLANMLARFAPDLIFKVCTNSGLQLASLLLIKERSKIVNMKEKGKKKSTLDQNYPALEMLNLFRADFFHE